LLAPRIDYYQEVAYWLSDDMETIDLGWPWRSILQQELYRLWRVFPSDS